MTEQSSNGDGERPEGPSPAQPGSKKIVLSALALGAVALAIYGTYIVAVVLRTG